MNIYVVLKVASCSTIDCRRTTAPLINAAASDPERKRVKSLAARILRLVVVGGDGTLKG